MENVTIPADVYNDIVSKIDLLMIKLNKPEKKSNPLSEKWLDIQEACLLLKISKRTMQKYRDEGIISFSQFNGKIYFKASDLEDHFNKNYVQAFASKKNKIHVRNSI